MRDATISDAAQDFRSLRASANANRSEDGQALIRKDTKAEIGKDVL
jgi:hypothetical protein